MGVGRVEDAWTKCLSKRQVCEKCLANERDVFWAFMDLEKAHDSAQQHCMWQMPKAHDSAEQHGMWQMQKAHDSAEQLVCGKC